MQKSQASIDLEFPHGTLKHCGRWGKLYQSVVFCPLIYFKLPHSWFLFLFFVFLSRVDSELALWESWCALPWNLGQYWGKFGIILWVLTAIHLLLSHRTFHPSLCQWLYFRSPLETLNTSRQKFTRLDGILKLFFRKRKDSSLSTKKDGRY